MEQRMNGLSRELIIHPGESLKEIIEVREMSQRELAKRIDLTEPFISNVINGKKAISVSLSKKLEYALGIEASFWINLQANYEKELADYEEVNYIRIEEINVLKKLKDIIEYLKEIGFLSAENNASLLVIELRKLLRISNLINIPQVYNNSLYRLAQIDTLDPYILFTWLRVCDLIAEQHRGLKKILDIEKLKEKLPEIKKLMFKKLDVFQDELINVFKACGIKFAIIRSFKGAPVQGVIKKNSDQSLNLIMTKRGKYADIFWFTLFHEIGHIINNDFEKNLVDYNNVDNENEERANQFAANILIDKVEYERFIKQGDYSIQTINKFCEINEIPIYILIGRLQKEKYLEYSQQYENYKVKYN